MQRPGNLLTAAPLASVLSAKAVRIILEGEAAAAIATGLALQTLTLSLVCAAVAAADITALTLIRRKQRKTES